MAGPSPRVIAVWGLFAALVIGIAIAERDPPTARAPVTRGGAIPLFAFDEPRLGAVEVVFEGRSASFLRDAVGNWYLHGEGHRHGGVDAESASDADTHRAAPDTAARIASQLEVTARMLADRRVTPEQGIEEFGLVSPHAMVAFYPRRGDGVDWTRPLDVLYVGDLLPDEYTYYAMKDGDPDVALVPRYQIALLLALAFGENEAPSVLPATSPVPDG